MIATSRSQQFNASVLYRPNSIEHWRSTKRVGINVNENIKWENDINVIVETPTVSFISLAEPLNTSILS